MKRGLAGQYETTSVVGETIRAFIPAPLPPEPALELSEKRHSFPTLYEQFAESDRLEAVIERNLEVLGYGR